MRSRSAENPIRYDLQPLPDAEIGLWDELIGAYETRELFHRRAWLDYLSRSRGAEIRFWRIEAAGREVGYYCGGIVRKGPFRILGSPLTGWGTNYMGPVVHPDTDQDALLAALDALAAGEGLAVAELEHPFLQEPRLAARGYEPRRTATYLVPLHPAGSDAMWRALDSTCRNRIRKAEKEGLVVEETGDPALADEFYDQYQDVMRHQGLVPPYPRETARVLMKHLSPAGLLLALRVRDRHGRVLATGLFPHDERVVYFWGGASWREGRESCPNELLHWKLMVLAAERGLVRYNMCGDGRFKRKFGGELVTVKRWRKCYWRSARWALRAYESYLQKQMSVRGFLADLVGEARSGAEGTALGANGSEAVRNRASRHEVPRGEE